MNQFWMRCWVLIVVASIIPVGKPSRLSAQAATGIPAVDSANAARTAWAAAVRASRTKDTLSTRREVEHAAAAWPTQQLYVWNRAVLAAAQADTAGVERALSDYADLGLGRSLKTDSVFARFRNLAWFEALSSRHEANRAPLVRSRVRATLSDSTLWPEGLDYDAKSRSFFVASVRHRTIVQRMSDGRERELWPRDRAGFGAVFGVRADPGGEFIWATMGGLPQMQGFTPADSTIASLIKVRLADGSIVRRWDLPPTAKHALGDLAIGPAGDVFVTDSYDPVLYRLRPGADSLESLRNPLFRSLQGLAPTRDGKYLYLADYSHGLLRVDLANRNVSRLAEPPHVTTLGVDGIVLYRGAIIGVQNGVAPARVMRFALDKSGERIVRADILDRNWRVADEPTIGTVVGDDFVYVANSQWEKYTDDGARKENARLTAPILLAIKLK